MFKKKNQLPLTRGNYQANLAWWHENTEQLVGHLMLSTFYFLHSLHPAAQLLLYSHMISELRASIAFPHRVRVSVCRIHGTEVDVACVPWVALNRDNIGHYCPLLSMVNDQYMSCSYLNKIAAHSCYRPEWTHHWLYLRLRQEAAANGHSYASFNRCFIVFPHISNLPNILCWHLAVNRASQIPL